MAQDSTAEGARRAVSDASYFFRQMEEHPEIKITDVIGAVAMKQQLALNRLIDMVEQLQKDVQELQRRR